MNKIDTQSSPPSFDAHDQLTIHRKKRTETHHHEVQLQDKLTFAIDCISLLVYIPCICFLDTKSVDTTIPSFWRITSSSNQSPTLC